MISVTEQSTGLRFRGPLLLRLLPHSTANFRFSASYITGAHAIKVGTTHRSGHAGFVSFDVQPLAYRFNNGVPNQITQRALPVEFEGNIDHDVGVFVQDRWTRDKVTALPRDAFRLLRQQLLRGAYRARRPGAGPRFHLPAPEEPPLEGHHAAHGRRPTICSAPARPRSR